MKFQKFIDSVQRASGSLRHLDYMALKGEVKRLARVVKCGDVSHDSAALTFAKQLEAEIVEVGCSFEVCLWNLKRKTDALSSAAKNMLNGEVVATDELQSPLLPLYLLEPLREWLPVAALADALRQHRLLQITGVVKIEKKFVKMVGVQPRPGFTAAELLVRSALSGSLVNDLCDQLEKLGDRLLQLGLASTDPEVSDTCSICLGNLTDPARLPCGHRFCIHCLLPLFGTLPDDCFDAVLLRCPLCRAAGPQLPQALCLDSLLARFGRGLSPFFNLGIGVDYSGKDRQLFTSVVVSSLARLGSGSAGIKDRSNNSLTNNLDSCASCTQDSQRLICDTEQLV